MATTTENNDIQFLVEYNGLFREIAISPEDNLDLIKKKLKRLFPFQQIRNSDYDIQWFNQRYSKYCRLDESNYEGFHQMLKEELDAESLNLKLVSITHTSPSKTQSRTAAVRARCSFANSPSANSLLNGSETEVVILDTDPLLPKDTKPENHSKFAIALAWLLPFIGSISFVVDAIWLWVEYDATQGSKQHNYAGLTSTILIVFYYLQYNIPAKESTKRLYVFYQVLLFIMMSIANLGHAMYYMEKIKDYYMMSVYIAYLIVDPIFIFCVCAAKIDAVNKRKLWLEEEEGVGIETLLHLISRLEILIIVLVPIYTNYDVVSTNLVAFFVLFDVFSKSFHDKKLKHKTRSLIAFVLLIILSTFAVVCESFEFVFEQRAKDAKDKPEEHIYENRATKFKYSSQALELASTLACYAFILLQFFKFDAAPPEAWIVPEHEPTHQD